MKEPKKNMKELAEKRRSKTAESCVLQKGSGRQDGYSEEEVQADKDTCACENN